MGDVLVLECTEVFAHLHDLFLKNLNNNAIDQNNHFQSIKCEAPWLLLSCDIVVFVSILLSILIDIADYVSESGPET